MLIGRHLLAWTDRNGLIFKKENISLGVLFILKDIFFLNSMLATFIDTTWHEAHFYTTDQSESSILDQAKGSQNGGRKGGVAGWFPEIFYY